MDVFPLRMLWDLNTFSLAMFVAISSSNLSCSFLLRSSSSSSSSSCLSFSNFCLISNAARSASALRRAEEILEATDFLPVAEFCDLDTLLPTFDTLSLGFTSSCMSSVLIMDTACISWDSSAIGGEDNCSFIPTGSDRTWPSLWSISSGSFNHCSTSPLNVSQNSTMLENHSFCFLCSSSGSKGINMLCDIVAFSPSCIKLSKRGCTCETFSFFFMNDFICGMSPLILFTVIFRCRWSLSILLSKAFAVSFVSLFPLSISKRATPAFIWLIFQLLFPPFQYFCTSKSPPQIERKSIQQTSHSHVSSAAATSKKQSGDSSLTARR